MTPRRAYRLSRPPRKPPTSPESPDPVGPGVHIIYDTDFGMDVDDVGALALLHVLEDKGELELLGVVSNVPRPLRAHRG